MDIPDAGIGAAAAGDIFLLPRPAAPMAFTGERMTSATNGQIEFEHYHRYCLARDLCVGCDVLDVASGEGYGAALLAGVARSVIGVEIDAASVIHARDSYRGENLRFLHGDALALPLPAASVDIAVSFETIEHLADHAGFLTEIRRVLRPGGRLIVSTPDRRVYSAPGSDPNPHHLLELSGPEFLALLRLNFLHVAMMEQRALIGSVIAAQDPTSWRSYERYADKAAEPDSVEVSNGLAHAPYLVAIATDAPLPNIPSSVYFDRLPIDEAVHAVVGLRLAAERETVLGQQLEALVQQRDAGDAMIARLRNEHTTRARESEQLRAELLQQVEKAWLERDAMLNSASWRMTGPLRGVAQRHPALVQQFRALRSRHPMVWQEVSRLARNVWRLVTFRRPLWPQN